MQALAAGRIKKETNTMQVMLERTSFIAKDNGFGLQSVQPVA